MTENTTQVIKQNQSEVTPSTFPEFLPERITPEQTVNCVLTTRVAMIQNLLTISEVITASFSNTKDLKTQLELSDKLRKTYNDISKLLVHLEENILASEPQAQALEFSRVTSPFLDYDKRKLRSATWNDYAAWCKMKEIVPARKGEFFEEVRKHGFRESVTSGAVTLVPPGLR